MPNSILDWVDRPGVRRWLVILAVAIGPLILVGRELVQGRVLFWGTPALQFVPWWVEGLRQISQGNPPLWNSLNGMGAPLLANYQSAFFYPPNWILAGFNLGWGAPGLAWGFTFLAMVHLIWGGLGMAAFLRRLDAGLLAQVVGGTAYALSGYWIGRLEFISMIWVGAWIPWLLRYVDEIASPVNLDTARSQRGWLYFPLMGVMAMMLLAGHAQLSWYALEFAGFWLAAGAIRGAGWRGLPGALGRFSIAGIAAGLLAAVQLIPTAEYLLQSQRAAAVDYQQALVYSFWPWRIVSLLAPDFFGNPGAGNFWGYASYWEDHAYLGVFILLLALGSIEFALKKSGSIPVGWLSKPVIWLLWGLIAVTLVLAFGLYTPVFPFLYRHIPTFSMFQAPARNMIWLVLAVILLGAGGIERWRFPSGKGLYWLRLATAGAFAVALGAGLGWVFLDNVKLTFIRATALAGVWGLGIGLLTLLSRYKDQPVWRTAWPLLVYVWVVLDLISAAWVLNPTVPASFYAETGGRIAQLQAGIHGQRIFLSQTDEYFEKFSRFFLFRDYRAYEDRGKIKAVLLPNINLFYGLALTANFDPLVPDRFSTWLDVVNRLPEEKRRTLLAMMNVGFIEKPDSINSAGIRYEEVVGGFPAAFYSCVEMIKPGEQSLLRMAQQGFSATTLWVEMDPPVGFPRCDGKSPRLLQPAADNSNPLDMDVSGRSGWLFISQTWYPGWIAKIDGRETPIYRANYAFMAVNVPEGTQKIELIYRPISYQVGTMLSILTLIGLVLTMMYHGSLKRRMQPIAADLAHRSK